MSTGEQLPRSPLHELAELSHNWGWFLALGIALVILGMVALGATVATTIVSVIFLGFLLMFGGGASIAHAFMVRRWRRFFYYLLVGILYLLAGLAAVSEPLTAGALLTLFIGVSLILSGGVRIVLALAGYTGSWLFVLLSGVISILLGALIVAQWPLSGTWVIGLFIGIELLMAGWGWIFFSLSLRNLRTPAPM